MTYQLRSQVDRREVAVDLVTCAILAVLAAFVMMALVDDSHGHVCGVEEAALWDPATGDHTRCLPIEHEPTVTTPPHTIGPV